jgi:hypothetical protein
MLFCHFIILIKKNTKMVEFAAHISLKPADDDFFDDEDTIEQSNLDNNVNHEQFKASKSKRKRNRKKNKSRKENTVLPVLNENDNENLDDQKNNSNSVDLIEIEY